jgi:hypothetical protein
MNLLEEIAFWWRTRGLPEFIFESQRRIAEYDSAANRAWARIKDAKTESEWDAANAYAANQFYEQLADHLARRRRRAFSNF